MEEGLLWLYLYECIKMEVVNKIVIVLESFVVTNLGFRLFYRKKWVPGSWFSLKKELYHGRCIYFFLLRVSKEQLMR